jgi:SAM-dependent methyltransferase
VLTTTRDIEAGKRSATAEVDRSIPSGPSAAAPFDYSTIPPGHYDRVFRRHRGIQSKWHHLKFQRVAALVAGYRRVLDVGCGPGTLIGVLGDEHESVGVDITQPQIDYAREVYEAPNRSFYACALQELPEEIKLFDAVTAVELIEHLPPQLLGDTLRSAVSRLRPGGRLVLTTPNYHSAWPLVERMVNWVGDVEYYVQHINRFTRPRFSELLAGLGLRDVRVGAYLALAPFSAICGWRFADRVARLEGGFIEQRLGLLLIGAGTKPG